MSGNQVQLKLGMTFNSAFAGSHRVTALVCDGANNGCNSPYPADVSLGTWQVVMPPTPMISSVTPASGKQGRSVPIAIVGTNTHFSGSSVITVSGTGVTVSGTSSSSATQVSATLIIGSTATASARTLTVTTGAEVVTSTFTVNPTGLVQLSGSSLTFPSTNPYSTSNSQSLTLTNTGQGTLNISSISASAEFVVDTVSCLELGCPVLCGNTLAAGSSCTIAVSFQPIHLATRTGTVTIVDDAPNSPQTFTVSGYANLILPLSRPDRPSRPVAVPTGGTTSVPVSKLDSFGIADSGRLTCTGPSGITCSVKRSTTSGEITVTIEAREMPPGSYMLYLATPGNISSPEISVPVEVKPADSDDSGKPPEM
jgi:hypothetical protein